MMIQRGTSRRSVSEKRRKELKMEKILVTKSSMPKYEEYIEAIKPLWESHWITNMGYYHKELEKELQKYLGVSEVSLTVNGHMALELILQAFHFPEGSEVITTPFTFISTTHAIVRNGLKPIFCDVKEDDGTIDEKKIEELISERTVAILPVHVYGNMCEVDEIQRIADRHNLKVIYDAAHAFGVRYRGRGAGSYGDASIFSFHATKVFNSIEGGAVTFCNHELYEKLYNLKNFGIRGEERVEEIGANAKMNEFCAIMGLCNLKRVEEVIENRKKTCELYKSLLSGIKGIRFIENNKAEKRNFSYMPIVVEKDFPLTRDELFNRLREKQVYARKYFYPLTSDQECYKDVYKDCCLPIARQLSDNVLVLPLFEGLTREQVEFICKVITENE